MRTNINTPVFTRRKLRHSPPCITRSDKGLDFIWRVEIRKIETETRSSIQRAGKRGWKFIREAVNLSVNERFDSSCNIDWKLD